MDTMRRKVLWAGGLAACVLVVAIGVRAADSPPVKVGLSAASEFSDVRLDQLTPGQLEPLPEFFSVKTRYPDGHPMRNALAGAALPCSTAGKEIYSAQLGQFLFRPNAGFRVTDDLITELVSNCSICSLSVRVTGGVEDGDGVFRAEVKLFDGYDWIGSASLVA